MEVDSSENWANFDDMSMDTASNSKAESPWQQQASTSQPVAPESGDKESGWANFEEAASTSENNAAKEGDNNERWADFTNFSQLADNKLSRQVLSDSYRFTFDIPFSLIQYGSWSSCQFSHCHGNG
jgi:hypothetical protein